MDVVLDHPDDGIVVAVYAGGVPGPAGTSGSGLDSIPALTVLGNSSAVLAAPAAVDMTDLGTMLGLDSAAFVATSAFDAAGTAAAAITTAEAYTDTQIAALSLGTASQHATSFFLQAANNLSDLTNAGTARTSLGLGTAATFATDTDTTLAADSDLRLATQHAVKSYIDTAVTGLLDFKGAIDASSNPNYPAASKGDAYVVSVAGKVGGASGTSVDVGDMVVATADNAGGTQASVGTSWTVLEHNLVGAMVGANNLSEITSALTARSNLGLGNVATLNTGTGAGAVVLGGVITASGPQGDASHTQVLTWNAAGQLTAVTNTAIAIANTAVSGLGTMSTQNANNVTISGGAITGITDLAVADGGTGASTAAGAIANLGLDADIATLSLPASTTISAFGATLVDDADASTARSTLGLGTIATQASSSVTITGGSITGITDLAVADGGTGASTLTNHGVLVGAGTSAVSGLTAGTNGQLLIGQSSANPAFTTVSGDITIDASGVTTLSGTANVESIIRANSLDQFATAAANVSLNSHKLINVTDGSAAQDAATWGQVVIAAGKSAGQTVIGDTAASGNLVLQSTSNATRGVVQSTDQFNALAGGTATYTAAPTSFIGLGLSQTYTLNFSNASMTAGVNYAPTIVLSQSASGFGMDQVFVAGATYKNTNGTAANLKGVVAYNDTSTFQGDNATITMGNSSSYRSAVTYGGINSATVTAGTHTHVTAALTINAASGSSVTVATRTGYLFSDATLTGAGTKALTTQVGIDIANVTAATTNIGIRNASSTVFTPLVKTITAVSDSISVAATHAVTFVRLNNTSGSSKTLTSTPQISDGQAGQLLIIENSSAQNVVFSRDGQASGSNLRLGAATRTLGQYDTLTLIYDGTNSEWVEIAFVDNT